MRNWPPYYKNWRPEKPPSPEEIERMVKGKQRRCNLCSNTYTWKETLSPEDIEGMAENVEIMNRKLVCSWLCYFKLVGRFVNTQTGGSLGRTLITGAAVYQYNIWYGCPQDEALDWNLAHTRQDQEHYFY